MHVFDSQSITTPFITINNKPQSWRNSMNYSPLGWLTQGRDMIYMNHLVNCTRLLHNVTHVWQVKSYHGVQKMDHDGLKCQKQPLVRIMTGGLRCSSNTIRFKCSLASYPANLSKHLSSNICWSYWLVFKSARVAINAVLLVCIAL